METLALSRSDGVFSIPMSRPQKKNAADGQMFRELAEAFAEAARR
jgi:enoyl-CoA hydratase/carnithine racemase